jgi:hypothetical protein
VLGLCNGKRHENNANVLKMSEKCVIRVKIIIIAEIA